MTEIISNRKQSFKQVATEAVTFGNVTILKPESVKSIYAHLDQNLTLEKQVFAMCKS